MFRLQWGGRNTIFYPVSFLYFEKMTFNLLNNYILFEKKPSYYFILFDFLCSNPNKVEKKSELFYEGILSLCFSPIKIPSRINFVPSFTMCPPSLLRVLKRGHMISTNVVSYLVLQMLNYKEAF